ncbi:hypothetical protein V1504DRAFT_336962 [Lipomyces starkeyi]
MGCQFEGRKEACHAHWQLFSWSQRSCIAFGSSERRHCPSFLWAYKGHNNLSIIEEDGDYTQPLPVDYLQIGPGERFSVLLKSKSRKELKLDRAKDVKYIKHSYIRYPL